MNELINRPEYMNRLIEYRDKDVIKLVTGIRRSGKSTLLDLYEQYLLSDGIPASNIIHMNLESLKYRELLDYLDFYDYVSSRTVKGKKNYLIFDELQMVKHWEKAIESFRIDFGACRYIHRRFKRVPSVIRRYCQGKKEAEQKHRRQNRRQIRPYASQRLHLLPGGKVRCEGQAITQDIGKELHYRFSAGGGISPNASLLALQLPRDNTSVIIYMHRAIGTISRTTISQSRILP